MTIKYITISISALLMTGCQTMLDVNQELNDYAVRDYNQRAAKSPKAAQKCWGNLQKVQNKIKKSPSLAVGYLKPIEKQLYDYNYGSGCLHVPGYRIALEQTFYETQRIASFHTRPMGWQ